MRNATFAAAVLALTIAAATTPAASAKGSSGGETCLPIKSPTSLPCWASEGQTYGEYSIPDGADDTEASLEAVLGVVEGEPTDVTSVAHGLTDDTAEFDFAFPNSDSGTEAFDWEYSGEAPLAFVTVTSEDGTFAIYDVFKQTEGEIDVAPELGEFDDSAHVSFWQRTYSDCEPVRVDDQHGKGMLPGCQLAEIVNGKVPCVHMEKEKTASCRFRTGKHASGKWLEGIKGGEHSNFAMGGQGISKKGKRGGPWVVASKATHDAGMPCKKPPPEDSSKRGSNARKRDVATAASDTALPGSGVQEVAGSTTNRVQLLKNFATREVCTNSQTHPDGVAVSSHPSGSVWCFTGMGAGLNDPNGMERRSPEHAGTYSAYYSEPQYRHFIPYNNAIVAAAKRPATKPNGTVLTNTPIAWRVVDPRAKIAN